MAVLQETAEAAENKEISAPSCEMDWWVIGYGYSFFENAVAAKRLKKRKSEPGESPLKIRQRLRLFLRLLRLLATYSSS